VVVLSSYPQRHYWSTDHTAVESLLLFCSEKVWKLINRKFRSEIKECNICLSEISNQALAREKQWSLKVLKKKMSAFRLMLPKLVLSLRISHGSVSINISSLCLLFRSSHISLDWTKILKLMFLWRLNISRVLFSWTVAVTWDLLVMFLVRAWALLPLCILVY